MNQYVALHNHSQGSFLDGLSTVEQMAQRAKKLGMKAIAVTDHGECNQHWDFQHACDAEGVKPIFGIESYLVDDLVKSKEEKDKVNSHLCLWAEDDEGLSNLWAISSLAYIEGFYYKPRADWAMLRKHAKGIIASDGCMLSNTARFILADDMDSAREWLGKFLDVFGPENFFMELHTWQFVEPQSDNERQLNADMTKINQGKVRLAQELGIELIVVNDAHYSERCDHENHALVWAMSTNTDQTEGKSETAAWIMSDDEVYFWMSKHGIQRSIVEKAIENTSKIADRCNARIRPTLHVPLVTGSQEGDKKLFKDQSREGFIRKVIDKIESGEIPIEKLPEYEERFEYESDLIMKKGFYGYFNIVADYVKWAKERMLIGFGRGSSGGSLIAYVMDINEIDPIKYDLLFERFIDVGRGIWYKHFDTDLGEFKFRSDGLVDVWTGPEEFDRYEIPAEEVKIGNIIVDEDHPNGATVEGIRELVEGGLPDIDVDFPQSKRHLVREYLIDKYGADQVTGIGTFSKLGARGAVQDISRAMKIPYEDAREISKVISRVKDIDTARVEVTWDQVLQESGDDLQAWISKYPVLFEKIGQLRGLIRQCSTHAAGVIISDTSLIGSIPLRVKGGELTTQFPGPTCEEMGFIKVDLLGLRHLDTLTEADKMVNGDFDPYRFYHMDEKQYEDPEIWGDLDRGRARGIFQVEAASMQEVAKQVKPRSERDVADLISANRPGVVRSGMLDVYIERRQGKQKVEYLHPLLEELLGRTYGVVVYQEQVMKICQVCAGYSLEEAGRVRKMMGKQKYEEMKAEKVSFVRRCSANPDFVNGCKGRNPAYVADEIWRQVETAAIYAFNKSHGQAYALICAAGVYLKHYHFKEYITALMMTDPDSVNSYIREARREGLKLLPPDINDSGSTFKLTDEGIRWSLGDLKGVGPTAVKEIIENQPYTSYEDYISKTSGRGGRKRNVLEALIRIGAFDKLEDRTTLLDRFYQSNKMDKWAPDFSLESVVLDTEMELVGTYITNDPMEKFAPMIADVAVKNNEEAEAKVKGEKFLVGGQVTKMKLHNARNGIMAFMEVTFEEETIPVTVFANTYALHKQLFDVGDPVMVKCQRLERGCCAQEIVNLNYL